MPIQAFSFPVPETRFFQVGQHVYKFKIRRGSKISDEEEMLVSEFVSVELENAVRVVLMSLDNLHPFASQHFKIFPYKSRWERVSELRFRKGDETLFAYPFLITLYVEANEPIPALTVNHANKWVPSDRESRLDSPLLPISCALTPANEPKCRELHKLSEGAEEMLCGNEVYADSEESSDFDVTEQDAPDLEATEREKPGVFARLASIAAIPFSLLFRRS